jgi:CBS domain-containing protein
MTTSIRETFHDHLEELKRLRDQIRVDLHLASLDLRREWSDLERRLPDASRVVGEVRDATAEAFDGVVSETRRFRARLSEYGHHGDMTVSSLMTRDVATCAPDNSLAEAARRMWQRDVGCLAVVEHGRVVGMITDRDACMSGYLEGRRLDEIPAGTAMSRSVFACGPATSLGGAQSIMKDRRVRRLPVLDGDGHLLGIVTLGDLARGADSNRGQQDSRGPTADDVTATFAAIIGPQDGAGAPREVLA